KYRWSKSGPWKLWVNVFDDLPVAFDLTFPSNTVTSLTPTFIWQESSDPDPGDYVQYEIQYSSYQDFSVCISTKNITISSFTPSIPLQHTATYYWKVRAYDRSDDGTVELSTWNISGVWKFWTIDLTPPLRVVSITALDAESDYGGTINLTWTHPGDPEIAGYRIYYSYQYFTSTNSPSNSPPTYYTSVPSSVTYCSVAGLTDNYDYYFAVVSYDFNDNAYYSDLTCVGPVRAIRNIVDTSQQSVVVTASDEPQTKTIIDKGTNNGYTFDVIRVEKSTTIPLSTLAGLKSANEYAKIDPDVVSQTAEELASTQFVFRFKAPAGSTVEELESPVTIVIKYSTSSVISGRLEKNLRIYRLNEQKKIWELAGSPQTIDFYNNTVCLKVNKFSIFRLLSNANIKDNLNEVMVYPNPFKPGKVSRHRELNKIVFMNFTEEAVIRIFNLSGELVKTIEVGPTDEGKKEWSPVQNDSYEDVASGLYVYVVTNNKGDKFIGKLSIIR
ncbi:MAG: hypothetical protein QME68_08110, partial [Elusimicrobiota bacterium]|nr:hypothetical protein [Elusimicrobiota bacterium]